MTANATAAAEAITAAGFTPSPHSAFEDHRGARCFSVEISGPATYGHTACTAFVDAETGDVYINNRKVS